MSGVLRSLWYDSGTSVIAYALAGLFMLSALVVSRRGGRIPARRSFYRRQAVTALVGALLMVLWALSMGTALGSVMAWEVVGLVLLLVSAVGLLLIGRGSIR